MNKISPKHFTSVLGKAFMSFSAKSAFVIKSVFLFSVFSLLANVGWGQCPPGGLLITATSPISPIMAGGNSTVTLSGTTNNLPSGTYTVTYSFSGANTVSNLTSVMIVPPPGGAGSFYTAALPNLGTTTITISDLSSGLCSSTISANNNAPIITVVTNGTGCTSLVTKQYPVDDMTAPTVGNTIGEPTQWACDYNVVTNIVAGSSYTSTFILNAPVQPGYITIRSGDWPGTLEASGYSPVTWIAATSGTYTIHYFINSSCLQTETGAKSTLTCNSTPSLPIQLLSFNASCDKDNVNLTWSTATETNNNYFTIERSDNGEIWQYVDRIAGAGNSNTVLYYDYQYVAGKNVNYYRLTQTDFNGDFVVFEPIAVNCSGDVSNISFYPNPFNEQIQISTQNLNYDNATITLRDITGRVVLQELVNSVNASTVHIDVSHIATGMYTIEFRAGEFMKVEKILK